MIFERLTLRDYGPYAGSQTLDLQPAEDAPVVLVGGLNGEGKTTLLEAVLHALYGARSAGLIPRAASYDQYLRSTLRSGSDSASVGLTFRVLRDGEEMSLTVKRTWELAADRIRESLEVLRGQEKDAQLTDSWGEFVETVIPRGVAPLFFFDGERVEELADLERAAATVRTAILSLLGLDVVEQLSADLKALERRHAARVFQGELAEALEAADKGLGSAHEVVIERREQLAGLRTELDRSRQLLVSAEERFRSAGGEHYEQRAAVEGARDEAKRRLSDALDQLRELAAGEASFLLCEAQLEDLAGRGRMERQAELAAEISQVLEARDRETVELMRASGVVGAAIDRVAKHLAGDRRERQPDDLVPVARLSTTALGELEAFLERGRADVRAAIGAAFEARDRAEAELEAAERAVSAVPSEDAIAELLSERTRARESVAQLEARVERCLEELAGAERAHKKAEEEQERVLSRLAESELADSDSTRIVRYAERTRSTLVHFRESVAKHHIQRIEALVSESLSGLLRKKRLISRVRIDPESYAVELIAANGRDTISPERLSAGERQLTALGLLWGLARASGRRLPVIIDTPLGRLDASHRSLVIERYLPQASHQVIVLSTDTELDVASAGRLGKSVVRSYRLDHSDRERATRVVSGYFGSEDREEAVAA